MPHRRRTISTRALRRLPLAEEVLADDEAEARPRTRADCADGPRPCPWVGCRPHLYLEANENGSIKLHHPELEPHELAESCALDVAERGGVTLDVIGELFGVVRERVRQIEAAALKALARGLKEHRR